MLELILMALVDPATHAQLEDIVDLLDHRLLRQLYRSLRGALYTGVGRPYKPHVARDLNDAFKVGGARVAGAFGVYTAGKDLDSLRLGVFTRWAAAKIHQTGGVIRPARGRWLVFPVTPRAFTTTGRIKRSWRTPDGRFKPDLFKDLRPLRIPGKPGILYVRDVNASVARDRRTGRRTSTRLRARGQANAVEPVFMLIRYTRRRPVLRFFKRFERFLATTGGRNLDQAWGRAVDTAARSST